MSINEAPVAAPNLTPEQRRQQEAAILGVTVAEAPPPSLTPEQIEMMRITVMRHDAAQAPREFDLNNPPRKPYQHQDYPKMLYHHEDRMAKVVKNIEQENGLLGLGYVREPFVVDAQSLPQTQLDAATLVEIARIDAEARKKKPAR